MTFKHMYLGLLILVGGCGANDTIKNLASERCSAPSGNPGNVGEIINSRTEDFGPVFIGNRLIYSSAVTVEGKYPKALKSELISATHSGEFEPATVNQHWDKRVLYGTLPLLGIPENLNEGAMCILPEKHRAIFAAERVTTGSQQSSLFDLYEVSIDDALHATNPPVPLAVVNDSDAWDSQPALTSDGQTLFFVSDRSLEKGGLRGNQHIWRSKRVEGVWQTPKILDAPYTTTGNDITPFVSHDEFYFSSDGKRHDEFFYFASDGNPDGKQPGNYGHRDIYRVPIHNGELKGAPERLPAPYNSALDDDFPFMAQDLKTFWLSSSRSGGCGERDLYAFTIPDTIKLAGKVTLAAMPIQAKLFLRDNTTSEQRSFVTDVNGEYEVLLRANHRYTLDLASGCGKNKPVVLVTHRPFFWDMTHSYLDSMIVENFEIPQVYVNDTLGRAQDIPFFITGYWRPNTNNQYQIFNQRRKDAPFSKVMYFNDRDFGYEKGSHSIDRLLDTAVYEPIIDSILPQITNSCFDSSFVLAISVVGWTDLNHINILPRNAEGIYPDGSLYWDSIAVKTNDGVIKSGDPMDGDQFGNVKLSWLRAYYSSREIKLHLLSDPRLAGLYRDGRIRFYYLGRGIDNSERGGESYNRHIDITAKIQRKNAPTEGVINSD
jgi:hypothetical protein